MDPRFEQAKAFFLQGAAHYEAGRYAEAERAFAASLSLVPDRPSTLANLGAVRLKLGRTDDAIELLREALARDPQHVQAHGHLAAALADEGRPAEALPVAVRSTELDPANVAGWVLRGTLERELGQRESARASFQQALERGADPHLVGYFLAAVSQEVPPAPPRQYVEQLFDGYEAEFEQHLRETLQYRAPEILAEGLARPRYDAVLDLGCGTGLCAPLLRPRAGRLDGVDLSAAMVERARAGGLYDEVVQADLAEHLASTPQRYDLLVAADVFIYVGALERVFEGAARVLRPGGGFAFSAEAADEHHTIELRLSLRYAHSERYIRMLAGQYGFELRATARHPLRIDRGQPLPGLFAWLTRTGSA